RGGPGMTEAEWLACSNPTEMMRSLRRPSTRKLRLVGCAACRRVWHLLTDSPGRKAVEVAETHADGLASDAERLVACNAFRGRVRRGVPHVHSRRAGEGDVRVTGLRRDAHSGRRAARRRMHE